VEYDCQVEEVDVGRSVDVDDTMKLEEDEPELPPEPGPYALEP
jgi:hypothetical protein